MSSAIYKQSRPRSDFRLAFPGSKTNHDGIPEKSCEKVDLDKLNRQEKACQFSQHVSRFSMEQSACADPENFARGGPTLTTFCLFFLVDEGRDDPNTTKMGDYRPASETPF